MTRQIEALIANDEQAAKIERIIMAGLQPRMDEFNNLPHRPAGWANNDPNAPFPDGEASPDLIRDVRCYCEARDNASRFDREAAALRSLLEEVERLRGALKEGRRAIGEHWAPNDCYATGPMTGDPIRDLVQCPACSFIALHDVLLKETTHD